MNRISPTRDKGPRIGWDFMTFAWPRKCNVPTCARSIRAGHVRVDRRDGPALCVDCYSKIMLGLDPDPSAPVPEWEKENRAASRN